VEQMQSAIVQTFVRTMTVKYILFLDVFFYEMPSLF